MPSTGPPRAVQPPAQDVCCFCGHPGDPGVPGQLAVLVTAPQAPPRPTLAYHEACCGYSSAVAWGRKVGQKRVPYGAGEIPPKLVHSEWTRGARLACTICGQPGATVCCKGIRECGVCWHYTCARKAAQERQDVVFSATQREVACSEHAASIVSRVREPAGLWLQGCGGWDDQDEQVASSWWRDKAAIHEMFGSDSEPLAGQQQQQPGAAPARGAAAVAAAPASPSAAPAAAPASCGVQQPEVIDLLVDDDEDEEVAPSQPRQQPKPPPPEQGQQQAPAAEPLLHPQHEGSPEPPAAAARLRRLTHKQVHPPVQKRRQPRPAAQLDEALPLSRGGAAAAGGSLQREAEAPESEEEADEKAWRLPGHQWVLRGDIGGPPPHRPRDLLVLNTVIPYRRQFRAVTRAYQQRMQENPAQFPPVVVGACGSVPTESERLKAGKAIEDYIKRHAGLKGYAKLSSPDQLPEVLPMAACGERFPIPPNDPRAALAADAGALGWRNHNQQPKGRRRGAARVPRFTVLGSYQSLQLRPEHYDEMMFDEELANAMGISSNQLVLSLEAYGADADLDSGNFNERGSATLMPAASVLFDKCGLHDKSKAFTHSAFGFGNETALINDVALDPIADVKAGRADLRKFRPANCAFLECLVFGWPFMFVLTIRDVEPQEEFLLEYGRPYWVNVRRERERCRLDEAERQAQAQRMQEAQARLLELQRQQEQHMAAASGLPTSGDHEAGITQASGVAASHVGAPAVAAPAEPAAIAAAEAEQQREEQQVQQQEQEQEAAAAAAAAAAAPAGSMQGSPISRAPAAGEAVATSPGPKPPRKPLASPATAAGGSQRSGSKRGRSRSRSRSRSRGRSRSRDKARRQRSRDRKGSPCKPRSRSRERRRSRTRSGSRKRHRHERSSPRRHSGSGRGREEERRGGKSGHSACRSGGRPHSRDRREAPSSRQQRSEPAVPPGFAVARQPQRPPGFDVVRQAPAAQEQRPRHGASPQQQHPQQRSTVAEPARQVSAKAAVSPQQRHPQPSYPAQPQAKQQPYQPPPQASPRQQPSYPPPSQVQQQQQQHPYQPSPQQQQQHRPYQPAQQQQHQQPYQPAPQVQPPARPPAAPARGGWEDSPPRQPMPPPADGSGTPDVDSDPLNLEPEPPRDGSGTPDVMDDWQVPAEVLEPWEPVVGPPPPGWQPPQRQQQPQPAWQQQQAVAQPAAAEQERERSVTPDVDDDPEAGLPVYPAAGPAWAPPAYQQPQQQPAPQQQWQQPPQQPRPLQQQAPQQPQQAPQQQQQQQPWRQHSMASQQPARPQYQWPARPAQMEQRQQSYQQRPQPQQQQVPRGSVGTTGQPSGFSSRPQSRASLGSGGAAAAGRMPAERQQQQPAGPGSGSGRGASAARHVLPEPVPVGQSGHMLDRHAATARGLPRKDSRTTK